MGITTDIRDRLIAIERTMVFDSELVKAAAYIPEKTQPYQTPIFLNFIRTATRVQVADTFYNVTLTWELRLLVKKEGDGFRSANEDMAMDLIDLTYALFLPKPRLELNGSSGVTNLTSAQLTGDSGIPIDPYPVGGADNTSYYTILFGMQTVYRSICT